MNKAVRRIPERAGALGLRPVPHDGGWLRHCRRFDQQHFLAGLVRVPWLVRQSRYRGGPAVAGLHGKAIPFPCRLYLAFRSVLFNTVPALPCFTHRGLRSCRWCGFEHGHCSTTNTLTGRTRWMTSSRQLRTTSDPCHDPRFAKQDGWSLSLRRRRQILIVAKHVPAEYPPAEAWPLETDSGRWVV